MSKIRIPVHGNALKSVVIPKTAAAGAQVGVNLLAPDGSVVKWSDILNPPTSAQQSGGASTFDGTSDDVPEGQYNLYFTNARAYAWAKTHLIPGANIAITFNDTLQTATIAATSTAGVFMPVVTGDVPPVLVYLDDGSLVYTEII